MLIMVSTAIIANVAKNNNKLQVIQQIILSNYWLLKKTIIEARSL
jgi:hypothetical protein